MHSHKPRLSVDDVETFSFSSNEDQHETLPIFYLSNSTCILMLMFNYIINETQMGNLIILRCKIP